MTPQQHKFYRWASSEARRGYEKIQRRKLTNAEWDIERRHMHKQAGAPESSALFNNVHLDNVLAVFFSWSHPAGLNLQLDQLNQPTVRLRYVADDLLDKISGVLEAKGREKQAVPRGPGRDGYILHIARRVSGDDTLRLDDLTEQHWIDVIIRLRYRYNQVTNPNMGEGRNARRRRPMDGDTIPRPQDRRKPIQSTLKLDDYQPF